MTIYRTLNECPAGFTMSQSHMEIQFCVYSCRTLATETTSVIYAELKRSLLSSSEAGTAML
jgi:hypothetical protein